MSHLRLTPQQLKAYEDRVKAVRTEPAVGSAKKTGVRSSEYEGWLANQLESAGLPKPARQFRWLDDRMYECDLAYPPLIIEIDGAAHRIKGRFMDDIEKNQQAILNGYYLLRIATSQVRNGKGVEIVKQALARIKAYGTTFDVEHSK